MPSDVLSWAYFILPDKVRERIPDKVKYSLYYKHQMKMADINHDSVTYSLSRKKESPDHVLIIVIDALRPDFIPPIPLDFSHAIAPAPWTFPSVTSIHTGLQPSDHGAVAHTHPDDEEYAMPAQTESHPPYPLDLEAAGYETYAGLSFTTPFLAVRGWYQTHHCYPNAAASEVISDYRKWRQNYDQTAAYLHLGDLHAPVTPPDEYVEQYNIDKSLPDLGHILQYKTDFDVDNPDHQYYRDEKIKLHKASLDYISDHLQPLINAIKNDTLLIITGDHGEGLWEHQELDRMITDSRPNYCFGHGGTPFDVIARVPLAVSCPNSDLSPHGGWATLRDIPATILDSTIKNRQCQGHSWHEQIPKDRFVVCEGARYGVERKAVYQNEYKLIHSRSDDVTLTAELSEGTEEFGDIPDSIEKRLFSQLPEHWDDMDTKATVSRITQERLEALGYK